MKLLGLAFDYRTDLTIMLPAFQSALENMFATQNQIKVDLESCVNVQLQDAAAVAGTSEPGMPPPPISW